MDADLASQWLLENMQAFIQRTKAFETAIFTIVKKGKRSTFTHQEQMMRVREQMQAYATYLGQNMAEVASYHMAMDSISDALMPLDVVRTILRNWDKTFASWCAKGWVQYRRGELFSEFSNHFNHVAQPAEIPEYASMLSQEISSAQSTLSHHLLGLGRRFAA